ncbi:uncharacterized protein LOC133785220 [Humulus lupulus]|uniref:uncharacterized protein LOC133785220 n=1 Tax=Humulus lupulus TaxID=3486 RepID=UPI002B40975C|nr:uncharacterized protein LOC133785220 [Humulus lupulus]
MNYVKKYDSCPHYANILLVPPNDLTQMTSPRPFTVWGIDLIGSVPTRKGGVMYGIMAVNYFMKWVETKPLATITSKKVLDSVIKNIVYLYGISRKIVSDNGLQLDNELFTDFCERHGFMKSFYSVAHPQANGQVEAFDKTLKATLKKKFEQAKDAWPKELAKVL